MKIFEFISKLFDRNRIFQPGTKQAGIPHLNIWNDNYQEIKSYEQPKRCGALFETPKYVDASRARLLYKMQASSWCKLCISNDQKLYVESGSCGSSGGSAVSFHLFGLASTGPNFKNPWEYYIKCYHWVVLRFSHYVRQKFGDLTWVMFASLNFYAHIIRMFLCHSCILTYFKCNPVHSVIVNSLYRNTSPISHATIRFIGVGESKNVTTISHPTPICYALPYWTCGGYHPRVSSVWPLSAYMAMELTKVDL